MTKNEKIYRKRSIRSRDIEACPFECPETVGDVCVNKRRLNNILKEGVFLEKVSTGIQDDPVLHPSIEERVQKVEVPSFCKDIIHTFGRYNSCTVGEEVKEDLEIIREKKVPLHR